MRIFPEFIDPEMVTQNIRGLVLGTVVVEERKVPVCVLDEFDPTFVVHVRSIGQSWASFSDTFHVKVVLLTIEETSQVIWNEGRSLSLCLQDAFHFIEL